MVHQTLTRSLYISRISVTKIIPNNLKGKKLSSQHWLTRHLQDPYVEKAKMMNYRCRSAFKLLEIDEKVNLLKPGQTVIDCGAAPGSWTQIAVRKTNSDGSIKNKPVGCVIAVDKLQIYPVKGSYVLGNTDFTVTESQNKILELLNGKQVDVVLSDMAPNATGVKEMDHENIVKLCYCAIRFALQISNINADILLKIWNGRDLHKLENDLKRFYNTLKLIKPLASRSDSAELFILAKGFKGLKR